MNVNELIQGKTGWHFAEIIPYTAEYPLPRISKYLHTDIVESGDLFTTYIFHVLYVIKEKTQPFTVFM